MFRQRWFHVCLGLCFCGLEYGHDGFMGTLSNAVYAQILSDHSMICLPIIEVPRSTANANNVSRFPPPRLSAPMRLVAACAILAGWLVLPGAGHAGALYRCSRCRNIGG